MDRFILWVSVVLLWLAVTAQSPAAQAVSNPILPHADPFITWHAVHGRYLLLATTGGNITLWDGPTVSRASGQARVVFTPANGLTELWSPTLWHVGHRWWIYFTARAPGKEHAIYVLQSVSDDPKGDYKFMGELDLGRPSIDPSLLRLHGVNYLMYVTVDRGENATHLVRLATPMHTTGQESLIAEPEFSWEKGAGSPRNYPVDEGPTALYHDGRTFIVFSGSDTASSRYCLGLLTFRGGDPLDRSKWAKSPEPVFTASPEHGIYGPGRGTFAEEHGRYWMLYAAKTRDTPTAAGRETRAQRFTWNADGTPAFGEPQRDGPISPANH